jgi:acetyl-CoA C-acetyltransferase
MRSVEKPADSDALIVEAVRSPVGKRNGGLANVHPADLLGTVQAAAVERSGLDPAEVGQAIAGCVGQVGEQARNISRTAWLAAGLPTSVGTTTIDAQCGSSQQATSFAAALVIAGVVDIAVGCGVESMTRVPMGSATEDEVLGDPVPQSYRDRFERTTQFMGAERVAQAWGVTREDADEIGLRSQLLAARAWSEGRFDGQIVGIDTVVEVDGGPQPRTVSRDEGLRESSLQALGKLRPILPEGIHTAGNASQISDGASAVLVSSAKRAAELGLQPKARILDHCLVGSDPELVLTGPIDATKLLLQRNGMRIEDIDVVEINEAFASVVVAWQRELKADRARVNPNGGAIALGHPLGGTGGILIAKALAELVRADKEIALVTMCCGGGIGTGMLLQRI